MLLQHVHHTLSMCDVNVYVCNVHMYVNRTVCVCSWMLYGASWWKAFRFICKWVIPYNLLCKQFSAYSVIWLLMDLAAQSCNFLPEVVETLKCKSLVGIVFVCFLLIWRFDGLFLGLLTRDSIFCFVTTLSVSFSYRGHIIESGKRAAARHLRLCSSSWEAQDTVHKRKGLSAAHFEVHSRPLRVLPSSSSWSELIDFTPAQAMPETNDWPLMCLQRMLQSPNSVVSKVKTTRSLDCPCFDC